MSLTGKKLSLQITPLQWLKATLLHHDDTVILYAFDDSFEELGKSFK